MALFYCDSCGQQVIADDPLTLCDACRSDQYGGRASRHESPPLFVPEPAPMAGQLRMEDDE